MSDFLWHYFWNSKAVQEGMNDFKMIHLSFINWKENFIINYLLSFATKDELNWLLSSWTVLACLFNSKLRIKTPNFSICSLCLLSIWCLSTALYDDTWVSETGITNTFRISLMKNIVINKSLKWYVLILWDVFFSCDVCNSNSALVKVQVSSFHVGIHIVKFYFVAKGFLWSKRMLKSIFLNITNITKTSFNLLPILHES